MEKLLKVIECKMWIFFLLNPYCVFSWLFILNPECNYSYEWFYNFFQIRVRARDGGVPFRFNTSVVIVTMQRNFQSPTWRVPNYSKTVVESLGLGTVILTVNATDADPLVSTVLNEGGL